MNSKRRSTNDVWLESGPRPKKQRKILVDSRTTVQRRLRATPQLVLERDSSLTQMDWLKRSASMKGKTTPPSDEDDTTWHTIQKQPRKTTKKVRIAASDQSDEDYAMPTTRKAQKRKSKSPSSGAKSDTKKSTTLPPQRTTVTQLWDKTPPGVAKSDMAIWEQDWESQDQQGYMSEEEGTDDCATSLSRHVGPASKESQRCPPAFSNSSRIVSKRPYQTKTPRKREKYEIRSSQSPSSPESELASPSRKVRTGQELSPCKTKVDHAIGFNNLQPCLPRRPPLQERDSNVEPEAPSSQGKPKVEPLLSTARDTQVDRRESVWPKDDQSEVMKLLETSRLRQLQSGRKATPDQLCVDAIDRADLDNGTDDDRQSGSEMLVRVSTIQNSQSTVSLTPIMVRSHDMLDNEATAEDALYSAHMLETDNADYEYEGLQGTYNPAYSALDRDAARAFQTQTQKIVKSDALHFSANGAGVKTIPGATQNITKNADVAIGIAEVVVQRSQDQGGNLLQSSQDERQHFKCRDEVEIEESDVEECFPSDPLELADDAQSATDTFQKCNKMQDEKAIVPSTPPATSTLRQQLRLDARGDSSKPLRSDGHIITPSHPRPSQISTVVSSQPSPEGESLQHVVSMNNTPYRKDMGETEVNLTAMTSASSPLALPPWTPQAMERQHSHLERRSDEDFIERGSTVRLDSLADFSLLPPPSQLGSSARPHSSDL